MYNFWLIASSIDLVIQNRTANALWPKSSSMNGYLSALFTYFGLKASILGITHVLFVLTINMDVPQYTT